MSWFHLPRPSTTKRSPTGLERGFVHTCAQEGSARWRQRQHPEDGGTSTDSTAGTIHRCGPKASRRGWAAAPCYTHAGSGSLHRYQRRPARRRVTTPDHAPPPKPTGIGAWLGQEAEKVPGQAVFEPGSALTRMCWPWCSARHNAARRSRGAMRIPSGPSEAQGRLLDSLGPSDPCVG